MEQKKNPAAVWRSVAIAAICLLIVVSILYALGVGWKQPSQASSGEKILSLWTKDAAANPACDIAAASVEPSSIVPTLISS